MCTVKLQCDHTILKLQGDHTFFKLKGNLKGDHTMFKLQGEHTIYKIQGDLDTCSVFFLKWVGWLNVLFKLLIQNHETLNSNIHNPYI